MSKKPIHTDLIREIDAFCEARGVSRSSFGMNALGDPSLYPTLTDGRELRSSTLAKIRIYMATGCLLYTSDAADE